MKINNLHTLTDTFKILYGKPLGYQIQYYWKASWRTMPELMCLGIMAVCGLGPLFYCANRRIGEREPRYYRDITNPTTPEYLVLGKTAQYFCKGWFKSIQTVLTVEGKNLTM